MTGINTPQGLSESVDNNTSGNRVKKNILELLEESTEARAFRDSASQADLLQRLKNNPHLVAEEIRSEMNDRLRNSHDQYRDDMVAEILKSENASSSTIPQSIKNITDATILEKLNIFLLSTKSAQGKLKNKVRSLFADEVFDKDSPNAADNREALDNWIGQHNESAIRKYLRSPTLLRKHLRRDCFHDTMDSFQDRNSMYFFEKLGIKWETLTETEQNLCIRLRTNTGIVKPGARGGIINEFNHQDIRGYLRIIDKATCTSAQKLESKKDLIREFLPTTTPQFLVEMGIINEQQAREKVKTGLEAILGEGYFELGSDDEKREKQRFLEVSYTKGQYIEIPLEEYLSDNDFIERLFDASMRSTTPLTKNMAKDMQDIVTGLQNTQFDLGTMKITPDARGGWHTSFVENLTQLKAKDPTKPQVKNAQNFQEGSYIRIGQDRNGKKEYRYFRIAKTDVRLSMPSDIQDKDGNKVSHRGITMEDWSGEGDGMVMPGRQKGVNDWPYAKLATLLSKPGDEIEIITADEMQSRRISKGEDKINTTYSVNDVYNSIEKLEDALGWKPEKGSIYSTKDVKGGSDIFIEILSIDPENGKMIISDGIGDFPVSFAQFYEIATELKLREIGKYKTDTDINSIIQTLGDGFKDLSFESGGIFQTVKDQHGHNKKIRISHFMNEDGEGMYCDSLTSGGAQVSFGKVAKNKKGDDWGDMKGKANLKAFSGSSRTLSMAGFLNQIRDNGYKPYMNPKEKGDEIDHEDHQLHSHGTVWGKIMNWTSFSNISKAFDLYKHAWEHKMEKNSKFQAARFADKYLTKLMPEGMRYSLRSEAAGAQNEAMEGVLKMLEEMNGKTARLHVRNHILLNDDAKFEEVLAGLLYISKKTGQLYPEELSDLKNSKLWFTKLAITQGYSTRYSRKQLMQKCIEKTDKGAEDPSAISEMDLVERQLKYYEGMNFRIPPNIAPKFPGALVEGSKGNKEKGELEVNQRSNISQMNKYALSKLNVGEGWKAMGCIDRLHTKNGSPTQLNAIPFTLLMSNMPEYLGSEFRKALHSEGTGSRTSHAFKFGNEMSLVNTYRSVVGIAAAEVARRTKNPGILSELEKIEKQRHHIGEESHRKKTEDDQKDWINSIYDFWMKYGDKLQPILQMSDTFIDAETEFGTNDSTKNFCKTYKDRFATTSGMQNKQLLESGAIYTKNSNVAEGNMVPDHTPFAFTNMVNASFSAIYSQSGMMGTSQSNSTAYTEIFAPGVLGALYKLRNLSEEDIPPGMSLENVQRKRFQEYFAAIMYYLRTKGTNPPEIMLGGGKDGRPKMNYIIDLEEYGFNLKSSDFGGKFTTKPAGAEIEPNTQIPNPLVIDSRNDRLRCEEMFQNFRMTTARVTATTARNVGDTFDYEGYGG